VSRLHNRIHLLMNEEAKALRLIKETKEKADRIIKTKHEKELYTQLLQASREHDLRLA
jgi:hypothetical protein